MSFAGPELLDSLREEVRQTARRMAELGLVRGSSGNVSLRIRERILITASGVPYEALSTDQIIEIDYDGMKHSGNGDASSEWRMHVEIYRTRESHRAYTLAVCHRRSGRASLCPSRAR